MNAFPLDPADIVGRIHQRDALTSSIETALDPVRDVIERARSLASRSDMDYHGVDAHEGAFVFLWQTLDVDGDVHVYEERVTETELKESPGALFARIRLEHVQQCAGCGARDPNDALVVGAIDHCGLCGQFGTEWCPIEPTDRGAELRAVIRRLVRSEDERVAQAVRGLRAEQAADLRRDDLQALLESGHDGVRPWAMAQLARRRARPAR